MIATSWWHLSLDDLVVGVGTLLMAIFTGRLARQTRRAAVAAEKEIALQTRPELAAPLLLVRGGQQRLIPELLGVRSKLVGEVTINELQTGDPNTKPLVISFDVQNVGSAAAAITSVRVMSVCVEGALVTHWGPVEQRRWLVPPGGIGPVDMTMPFPAPTWLVWHFNTGVRFWLDITYEDLDGLRTYQRWLELQQHMNQRWFIAQILRKQPTRENLPSDQRDYFNARDAQA